MKAPGFVFSFDTVSIDRINAFQEALEEERAKLLETRRILDIEITNLDTALARLTLRRHQLVYGRQKDRNAA